MDEFRRRNRNPFYFEFSDDEIDPEDITPFHSSNGIPIITISTDENNETMENDKIEDKNNENKQEMNADVEFLNEQKETRKNIILKMRNNVNTLLNTINEKLNMESYDFNLISENLNELTRNLEELSVHLES